MVVGVWVGVSVGVGVGVGVLGHPVKPVVVIAYCVPPGSTKTEPVTTHTILPGLVTLSLIENVPNGYC